MGADAGSLFLVAVQVEALDRTRLLSDVTRVLSDAHVSIVSATVTTTRDRVAVSPVHLRDGRPQAPGAPAQAGPQRRGRVRRLPRHELVRPAAFPAAGGVRTVGRPLRRRPMSTRAVPVLLCAALLVPTGPAAAAPASGGVVGVGPVRLLAPADAPAEGSPALSRTGRWVVHLQSALSAAGRARLRVVRTDLVTGEVVLLSRLPDGRPAGRNHSQEPMGSLDGRTAVLQTDARLTADDTDSSFDAFVRDVDAGVTRLVSGGDGSVGTAALSGDGRSAVFTSSGTDLVPGSTGRNVDVYLRDLVGGGVQQLTVRPDGSPSRGSAQEADVDADGGTVVFTSRADDLAEADDDGGRSTCSCATSRPG